MGRDGLCGGEEERILTIFSVSPAMLGQWWRASKRWQSGEKSLAAIHLAQTGVGPSGGSPAKLAVRFKAKDLPALQWLAVIGC